MIQWREAQWREVVRQQYGWDSEKKCLIARCSHCSSLVGLVTLPDVACLAANRLSSLVGLSTRLSCHSSRGFDFGWEMVGACVRSRCGEGTTTVGAGEEEEDVLSWMVGNSGHCEMRDDSGWVPRGTGRGRINGQRCGVPRHLLGVQQERGEQVRNIEEGKQGESVHPCFLSSLSRFVHPPGPVDVVSPYANYLQKKIKRSACHV